MKHYSFWIILVAIGFSSCLNAQQPDNKKPMYGKVPKSEHYKKMDAEFITECLKYFGTIDSAAQAHIAFGWEYFCYNDLETSMKRFNQAWLLDTECPDVYFAFAALMEAQGNRKEAKRFDKIGHEKDVTKERAKICYEQIAFCKEQWKRKEQWEKEQKNRIKSNMPAANCAVLRQAGGCISADSFVEFASVLSARQVAGTVRYAAF